MDSVIMNFTAHEANSLSKRKKTEKYQAFYEEAIRSVENLIKFSAERAYFSVGFYVETLPLAICEDVESYTFKKFLSILERNGYFCELSRSNGKNRLTVSW